MKCLPLGTLFVTLVVISCIMTNPAGAEQKKLAYRTLGHALDDAAAIILDKLGKETTVQVKPFTEDQNLIGNSNSGQRVASDLFNAINKQSQLKVRKDLAVADGEARITGEYAILSRPDGKPYARLNWRMSLKNGSRSLEKTQEILDPLAAKSLGQPATFNANYKNTNDAGDGKQVIVPIDIKDQSGAIDLGFRNPQPYIVNGTVRPKDDSPYGVEIEVQNPLKRNEYVRRPIEFKADAKLLWCDLKAGESYRIRLHNDSNEEVRVEIKIDGLNVFSYADKATWKSGAPPHRYYCILPTKELQAISGWFIKGDGDNNATAFRIGYYADTPAPESDVGVITIAFHRFLPEAYKQLYQTSGLHTEQGDALTVKYKTSDAKGFIEPIAVSEVSIRYSQSDRPAK